MSAIFILIGTSLLVACGFLVAFILAMKNGQFEDAYTPSVRMLFDDEIKKVAKKVQEKDLITPEKTLSNL